MRWPSSDRETLITVTTMAVVATVLTLFERSTWGLLFVYTAAAGGLRLPANRNAVAVVGSTVLCVVTMSAAGETDPARSSRSPPPRWASACCSWRWAA